MIVTTRLCPGHITTKRQLLGSLLYNHNYNYHYKNTSQRAMRIVYVYVTLRWLKRKQAFIDFPDWVQIPATYFATNAPPPQAPVVI